MSSFYTDQGQALYNFFTAIDITGIFPAGWGSTFNYPPKDVANYPALFVLPAQDSEDRLDNATDTFVSTWWVDLVVSYNAAQTAESQLRQLVDLCATALRTQVSSASPLSGSADFLGKITGTWTGDRDQGWRIYRFAIELNASDSTY